ncbi:metallophosphoesterase family protein [Lactobacillus crispatus]|uniref:metallophosphoesterase family protein n=1 Tax=Lactobacillus crispatus TaxID=47770 RepID=UPI0018A9FB44|nr:metallophosphoesterase [Lactobacillus crispatus]
MITSKKKPILWLLSDTHLIADSLHDDGLAFQHMRNTSAGKDLDYQEIALTAFVRKVIQEKPTAVIITGDVTFNGAKISAERLADIFQPIVKNDIAFLVLPGNHDIFDGWARKFKGAQEYYMPQIGPAIWKEIFASSYQDALHEDPSSLAYSVNLNPQYRLILADSNIYDSQESRSHPITNGRISTLQLNWIERELIDAQKHQQQVLFFMHHNLYRHNKVIYQGYILDNAVELQALLQKYGVKIVFSGHMHAQNIIGPFANRPIAEVAGACFCMTTQEYGQVQLNETEMRYQAHSFEMKPWLTKAEQRKLPQQDFHQYLQQLFFNLGEQQLIQIRQALPDKEAEAVIKFADQLNWNFFIGKSDYSVEEKNEIINSIEYQLVAKYLPDFKRYLDSFLEVKQSSQQLLLKW